MKLQTLALTLIAIVAASKNAWAMRAKSISSIVLVACCSLAWTVSHAGLIYDNGSQLENSGMFSEAGFFNDLNQTWLIEAGDTFRLSQDATLSAIRWWGWNVGPDVNAANSFAVALYTLSEDNSLGFPILSVNEPAFYTDQVESVSRTAVGDFDGSFEYFAEVEPIALSANLDYLLAIVNDFDTPNDLSDYWNWRRSADGPNDRHASKQSITSTPGPWRVNAFTHDLAFELHSSGDQTTPVPEPATLALLGVGLLGFIAARRRRTA